MQVDGQKTTVVDASPYRVGMRIDLLRGVPAAVSGLRVVHTFGQQRRRGADARQGRRALRARARQRRGLRRRLRPRRERPPRRGPPRGPRLGCSSISASRNGTCVRGERVDDEEPRSTATRSASAPRARACASRSSRAVRRARAGSVLRLRLPREPMPANAPPSSSAPEQSRNLPLAGDPVRPPAIVRAAEPARAQAVDVAAVAAVARAR